METLQQWYAVLTTSNRQDLHALFPNHAVGLHSRASVADINT